ncbi:RcnB family protein [Desulfogranum marinum]|jgi:Ni/Co efflux regulator RcnB|uniref:RcnB family protein n=1 Tax=Desulfogranum marinum TaxID=453220 RepID=UPI001964B97F|nr:RcnB family protein [Desulfogranum marinum]MBM9511806.1 RcnB family protein [Desulfogranum marinum]
MSKNILNTSVFLILVTTLLLAFSLPAQADKPSWAGNNKGNSTKNNKKDKSNSFSHDKYSDVINLNVYFNNKQQKVIRNYYLEGYRRGHCPPGLAKMNNGCMPPGQAKKWKKGHPLPSDVVYYDLPSALVAQLGKPPKGNRYVRVANDILLMAVGTGMVVDAVQDISSM